MVIRSPRSVKVAFVLSLAILYQTSRILYGSVVLLHSKDANFTDRSFDVQRIATADVQNLDHVENIFVVVVSMQRSSSTFLSHQVLTGMNHSKEESPINQAPPMSTCPFRHFITLNEIFTNHPQQSGDAWEVEGADLVKGGKDPKELTVPQLSDFLQRVAQRRCRSRVQEDLEVFMEKDQSTQTQLIAGCPEDLRHHQCAVSYKHFDFHLPREKHDKLWLTLIPNVRIVILERKVVDRWSSFWVAKQTGDWNVHGTAEHKKKLAELKKKVPAVPDWFRNEHDQWYNLVREALEPSQLLDGVPKMDLKFDDVVAQPLEVRARALEMIWDETVVAQSPRQAGPAKKPNTVDAYDPSKFPTGSFANCTSDESSSESNSDTVTVACKTFRYKLVEETFRKAGRLFVGVLSAGTGLERRQAIRATWAKENGGVFFLVAGPWQIVSEEFEQYGDLIWLGFEENYRSITEKTAAFFYLVDKVTSALGLDYSYAAKVDDDTYVAPDRMLARFEWLARENGNPPDYWGRCGAPPVVRDPQNRWYVPTEKYPEEKFPLYCQGGGYALSKAFVRCAASGHIAAIRYFDFEDVFVGMLAERCGMTASNNDIDLVRQHRSGWRQAETNGEQQNIQKHSKKVGSDDAWLPKPEMARRIIQHNVFSADDMLGFHTSYLNHKTIALTTVSEGDPVNYYYDEGGVGWLEGEVVSVTKDKQNRALVSMNFGTELGQVQGIFFDEPYSGRWTASLMMQYKNLEEGSSNFRFTTATLKKMQSTVSQLESLSIPYYIYDNEIVAQSDVLSEFREKNAVDASVAKLDHIDKDVMAEVAILDALKLHQMRVDDPNKAELFVIPTPVTELALAGCRWDRCRWFNKAFDALEQHPIYKTHLGNKHVMIAASWFAFNQRFNAIFPALSRNYRRLGNVTVAHHYDPYAVQDIKDIASGYETLYEMEAPVSRAFSLGLGYDKPFDMQQPTFEKFEKSKFFIFYHSRNTTTQPFSFRTTKYRDAPLNKKVIDGIPDSSIGGPTSKEEWLSEIQSSQFCLVVRGDTPHSHAFLYSVRAGCIPVIISDNYPEYAGPLKSSLSMRDFCIFIKEESFLHDPLKELLQLLSMGKEDIKNLLKALAIAQRVIFTDHPQSLFVPAFMRELRAAQERLPPPMRVAVTSPSGIADTSLVVQRKKFEIRYSEEALSGLPSNPKDKLDIVVAVITKAHRSSHRRAIRSTWAKGQKLIFFAFNGEWEDIEKEFMEDGDIVWVRRSDITKADKALAAMSFVESYMKDYDYILKINDHGCAYMDATEPMLREDPHDYWGFCPDPNVELGRNFGYFISKKLNTCILGKETDITDLPQNDGVATRQLANACGVSCNNNGWDWVGDDERKESWFMDDDREEAGSIVRCYWSFMQQRKIGEWMEG